MAKRRRRKSRLQKLGADVLAMVSSAREASKAALQQLHKEIGEAKRQLEKLITEERTFKLDVFGTAR
jgi:ribosome-binding protein aMBF1 (putative translation factor)